MDTVEVLKAIQKAKEAKDRMNNTEKKVRQKKKLKYKEKSVCFYSVHTIAALIDFQGDGLRIPFPGKCKRISFLSTSVEI